MLSQSKHVARPFRPALRQAQRVGAWSCGGTVGLVALARYYGAGVPLAAGTGVGVSVIVGVGVRSGSS
jgi:hypothetical protein